MIILSFTTILLTLFYLLLLVFQQRVLEQRAQVSQQEANKNLKSYCQYCKKKFGSEKSYENHLASHKHQENVLNGFDKALNETNAPKSPKKVEKDEEMKAEDEMEEDADDDSDWEEFEEAIPMTSCLFCNHKSDTLESSMEHMSAHHSFFIPDLEFVIDVEGLITYLGERVGQGHICLWCGHLGRQFPTSEAVQKHMLDKGHVKMFHEVIFLFLYLKNLVKILLL